jgi:[ribosomal protein S5]-alanine N-acetyltransferase
MIKLKTIRTKRLTLRPMVANDVDAMLSIFTDPPVMAAFGLTSFSRQQMQEWVQRNLDHQDEFGYGLFSVVLKSSGQLIGDCGLEQMDVEGEKVAELGYDFHSDFWHQGYATEAAKAVRDYGFGKLKLTKLVSLIRVGNHPSKRVAERVGMSLISEFTRFGDIKYWKYGMELKGESK